MSLRLLAQITGSVGHLLPVFGYSDNRFAGRSSIRGERSGRFGEGPYCPDNGLEPSIPDPLSQVCEPGTVGFDDKEDGAPILWLD